MDDKSMKIKLKGEDVLIEENVRTRKTELKDNKILITKTTEIRFDNKEEMQKFEQKLRTELVDIVRTVKALKSRAEEIKELLAGIEQNKQIV